MITPPAINALISATLVAGHYDLLRVDHDDEVAMVVAGAVRTLVFAHEQASRRAGKATQDRFAGVDHPPLALEGGGIGRDRFHTSKSW